MEKEIKEHENENITQISLLGRKYQSVFVTSFMSERGDKPANNCYISYIELDNFGCWIVVDGNNGGIFQNKIAPYIGETIIENFIANPTIDKKEIEKMLIAIHKRYKNMQDSEVDIEADYSSCSIAMFVTDYAAAVFASVGNARYGVLRDNKFVKKSKDDTLAYLQYDVGNILYNEMRFRKDKEIFTKKFGADKNIKINVSDIFMLRPSDKILLYTQGAWENLDEEDIELISETSERPGRFIGNLVKQMKKNCYLSLENYTICGIYASRPLAIPAPQESNVTKIKSKIEENKNTIKKKILTVIAVLVLLGTGHLIYDKIKINSQINSIEKQITLNLQQGKTEIDEKDYNGAINSYTAVKKLYNDLEKYKNVDNSKIKEMDKLLAEIFVLKEAETLFNSGNELLNSNKFTEAAEHFEKAISSLSNISLNKNLKIEAENQLKIADSLAEAEIIKKQADKLYLDKESSNKEESINLYKKIAPMYKQYERNTIYNEIMEKIKKYEEEELAKNKKQVVSKLKTTTKRKQPKSFKTLPVYKGDIKFEEYKYFSSLKAYEESLKTATDSKEITYLKGKINMNKQLIVAVILELKGDEYAEKKKNSKKVREYYERALEENKKLYNNKYMPKRRYLGIIKRLEDKLRKLD